MLRDALVELLREKPYRTITVRQIVERAGLNRTTFYSHFQDKDDLLSTSLVEGWAILQPGDHRLEHAERPDLVTDLILTALDFLRAHRELGATALRELPYLRALRSSLLDSVELWARHYPATAGATQTELATIAEYVVGGCVNVFVPWLEAGATEPAADVAARLTRLVLTGAADAVCQEGGQAPSGHPLRAF
jgi:AcrR family transcriptional regulator